MGALKYKQTMKKSIFLGLAVLLMTACQSDIATENNQNVASSKVKVDVQPFVEDSDAESTRTTLEKSATGFTFKWSEGDQLGVFPQGVNRQQLMDLETGSGAGNASFTCQGFQLDQNNTYRAYYPVTDKAADKTPYVDFDYTGQVQDGNNNYAHLGKFDYLISGSTTPTGTNTAAFTMQHLGAIIKVNAKTAGGGTFKSMTLTFPNNTVLESVKLNVFNPSDLSNATYGNSLTLTFKNPITVNMDGSVIGYFMAWPMAQNNSPITVTLKSADGKSDETFSTTINKTFLNGRAYAINVSSDYVDLGLPSGNLWATKNLGATSVDSYGTYLAWGETAFKNTTRTSQYAGNKLAWDLANYYQTSQNTWYSFNCGTDDGSADENGQWTTVEDGTITVDPCRNLLGKPWMTPGFADWQELIQNCKLEWTTINNVNGVLFTSNINSRQLFLPAAGNYSPAANSYQNVGSRCLYQSSNMRYTNTSGNAQIRLLSLDASKLSIASGNNCENSFVEGYYYFGFQYRAIQPGPNRVGDQ